MSYNFVNQYPYQWGTSAPYIPNSYTSGTASSQPTQNAPPSAAPAPPQPPPGFHLLPLPPAATQSIPGTSSPAIQCYNTAGSVYPFRISANPFQNPNPAVPFDRSWQYSFNNNIGRVHDVQQTHGIMPH